MQIFSIDESDYTGHDLLQHSQPWQGACAVNISHDDARHLIKSHFPKLKASELKFSSLKRRDGNHKPLFALQQELLENFPCVTCVADKRFLLVQMFIDYAVEPFYYDQGVNLYENGGTRFLWQYSDKWMTESRQEKRAWLRGQMKLTSQCVVACGLAGLKWRQLTGSGQVIAGELLNQKSHDWSSDGRKPVSFGELYGGLEVARAGQGRAEDGSSPAYTHPDGDGN